MPELRVQSLVRELRFHVLHCVAKMKERKKTKSLPKKLKRSGLKTSRQGTSSQWTEPGAATFANKEAEEGNLPSKPHMIACS